MAAIVPGKVLTHGIGLNAPDGSILHMRVFFFQQQKMQANREKERRETFFQVAPQSLAFPIIQGMLQQHHAQIQVAFWRPLNVFAGEKTGPKFFLRA